MLAALRFPAIPLEALTPLAIVIASAFGGWIARHLKSPTDLERAQLLGSIATDAARLVVSLNPKAAWRELLEQTVKAVAAAAGVPTANRSAIERASARALSELGKAPA